MRKRKTFSKNILVIIILLVIVLGTGGFFFGYRPYTRIKAKGNEVIVAAKKVSAAFKTNNIDDMKKDMSGLTVKYGEFKNEAKSVYWMTYIPFLGAYASDFKNGVAAGDSSIKAAVLTIDAIEPYADLIGFKKGANFFEKSADDRLETAVLTLDKVLIKIDDISKNIDDARNSLDKIDANRYPEKFAGKEIRSKIQTGKDQFDGVASLFVDAKPLLKKLPEILGSKKDQRYLILFQNDKELRPTGGFLTAYAVFKVQKGRFTVVKSEDIYSLDASIGSHPKAPPEILKYHKGVSSFFIRDSNLSPDFVESLKLFNSLYAKSSNREEFDGIFTMDTHVLVDVLDILGPTEAGGVTFTSEQDKRCDCPQVIYVLLDNIDRPVNYVKSDRKGLLGQLLYAIMQKSLGVSPSRYWGRLSQAFMTNLQEKHVLINLNDKEAQTAAEKINFAGKINNYKGDYLHINDTNFAGAKSNLFVQESVESDSKYNSDGTVTRTITINYKNPYPSSDCNLERGGLCLNAILRNWLRVYVPQGSKLVSFKGSETDVETYDSLGKTVFEGFLQVKPLGKSVVTVTYTLPKGTYDSLLIQKQGGTNANEYTLTVDGVKKETFGLITDKIVKLK